MLVFEEIFASDLRSVAGFLSLFKEKYLDFLSQTALLRDRIEYSLMEAIDNAYEHGNQKNEHKYITVRCSEEGDFLTFSVLDEGDGFSKNIPRVMPGIADYSGRGLYSIHQFTHSVSFNDRGNMITFTFRTR